MRAVALKVLKNKLSEYVRLAAGGETVLVTDRDRVVAELVPPREGRSPLLADAMLAGARALPVRRADAGRPPPRLHGVPAVERTDGRARQLRPAAPRRRPCHAVRRPVPVAALRRSRRDGRARRWPRRGGAA